MNKVKLVILITICTACVTLILLTSSLPKLTETKLSAFISLYIFEVGFTYSTYISMNTTKKAEYLKNKFKWKDVAIYYNQTFICVSIGLVMTLVILIFNIFDHKIINYIFYIYLLFSQYILFSYWKFSSDFFGRVD